MADETEDIRRRLVAEINAEPGSRAALEAQYGKVWDTHELTLEYEVMGFASPFVIVRRKSDRCRGTLTFQHSPRFYFDWWEDK